MKIFTLLALLLSFIPFQIALADSGPKPSMDFNFTQSFSGEQISIVGGILFECKQADCSDAKPLEELGPQRFTCDIITCHANSYGYEPYHRIEIQFSDGKTRQSNIFETAGFSSIYNVTIQQDDLLVETQFNPMGIYSPYTYDMLYCLTCLLFLIVIVVFAVMAVIKRRAKKQ
jgi:hypothetical protein